MRKILHYPKFKELESAWRGLYFLVRGVETSSQLKFFLYDIGKAELSSILRTSAESRKFSNFRKFENEKNLALICGNYSFQINVDDVAMLIRLAKISYTINVPFVSHLDTETFANKGVMERQGFNNSFFADNSPEAKLWNTIRTIPEAESIGLLIQRLLIRLPYGEETEPTEKFSFEEFSQIPMSKDYLWTNPCFAVAFLLARNFGVNGWKLGESLYEEIEGLPTFILVGDAGTGKVIPKSEFAMTEHLCRNILQAGLMPILNYLNSDKISLAQFQSIAFPEKLLKGKWN
jgi:type VI secretion system protein ImpC